MKTFYSIIAMAFLFSSVAMAEEPATPPPAHHPQQAPNPPAKGMMDDEHLKMMQDHILAMHDLSNKILAETDPAKKEQLKQQQRELMKEHHHGMMGHPPKMQH